MAWSNHEIRIPRRIHHKWKERARIGVYLGRSPQHARSVALVLDGCTGLVSPQFHVQFDSSFHTVKGDVNDSLWQLKAGLLAQKKPTIRKRKKSGVEVTTEMAIATKKVAWALAPEGAETAAPEGASDLPPNTADNPNKRQ